MLLSALSLLECLCDLESNRWQAAREYLDSIIFGNGCVYCMQNHDLAVRVRGNRGRSRWFTRPIPSPILESYDPAIKLFTGDHVIYTDPDLSLN